MMIEKEKETLLEDTYEVAKTSWSLNEKMKGHQIVIAIEDQDHSEDSLPSSLMEEEEEEHVPYF